MDMFGLTGVRPVALAVTGLVLVACSPQLTTSAPKPNASVSPSAVNRGPMLVGTFSVGGDYTIVAAFATQAEAEVGGLPAAAPTWSTCAGYAAGLVNSATFLGPVIHSSGDPRLYLRVSVDSGYAGPGTYTGRGTPGLTGVATVAVASSAGDVFTIYNSRNSGITTLTVERDGSGTFSFAHWRSDENRGGITAGFLYGSVTWTCHSAGATGVASPAPLATWA